LKALRLLSEAWVAAWSERRDLWQFAIEINHLRSVGLSNTDLRCLLCQGYLEHARERSTASTNQRVFQSLSSLVLPKWTCFVLTTKGREAALKFGAERGVEGVASAGESTASPNPRCPVPRWDSRLRRLWWQDRLIKVFRRPAVNQERVLAALEEEGWPTGIDDPLPQTLDIDPKVRLHDTIKALNHHHLHRIIRFCGDGRGRGIQWLFGGSV
jgi:hypothetical protein